MQLHARKLRAALTDEFIVSEEERISRRMDERPNERTSNTDGQDEEEDEEDGRTRIVAVASPFIVSFAVVNHR